MKQVKKNPSRLRPFDQKDRDYFEMNKADSIKEHLSGIDVQLNVIKGAPKVIEKIKKERGGLSSTAVQEVARINRGMVRDLKVYINQLQEHLEQIEVTGVWK